MNVPSSDPYVICTLTFTISEEHRLEFSEKEDGRLLREVELGIRGTIIAFNAPVSVELESMSAKKVQFRFVMDGECLSDQRKRLGVQDFCKGTIFAIAWAAYKRVIKKLPVQMNLQIHEFPVWKNIEEDTNDES